MEKEYSINKYHPLVMTIVELTLFGIPLILISSAMLGFFTAYGVGANDVANAMGTSVGSKVLTIKQAVLVAAVFEFLGAFLAVAV